MSFVPINLIEDPSLSRKDIEAEHTRELQVEAAFKTFETALKCQKNGQLVECFQLYEELFKMDIISNHYLEEEDYIKGIQNGSDNTIVDELNFLSPNVKSLRYLIFRNRSFLYMDILKKDPSILNELEKDNFEQSDGEKNYTQSEKIKESFYSMIDDMVIALLYQEADELLLESLYEILIYIQCKKLARYTLEYTLSSKLESDDILGLLPLDENALKLHKNLILKLNQKQINLKLDESHLRNIETKYKFLQSIRDEIFKQIDNFSDSNVLTVKIRNKSNIIQWEDITNSINEKIKSSEDKSRTESTSASKIKHIDPYYFTTNSYDRLLLEFPDNSNSPGNENGGVQEISEEDDVMTLDPIERYDNDRRLSNVADEGVIDIVGTDKVDDGLNGESNNNDLSDKESLPNRGTTVSTDNHHIGTVIDNEAEILNMDDKQNTDDVIIINDEVEKSDKPEEEKSKNGKSIQRSSKRLQKNELEALHWLPNITLTNNMFEETNQFFKQINTYLSVLDFDENHKLTDIVENFVNPTSSPLFYQDFIEILNSYTVFKYFPLAKRQQQKSQNDDEKLKLLEVLRTFGTKTKRVNSEDVRGELLLDDYFGQEEIKKFVKNLNSSHLHTNEVKISILKYLVGNQTDSTCTICTTIWPEKLYKDVKTWILQLEQQIIQKSKEILNSGCKSEIVNELVFSVSLFEILADTYITSKSKIDTMISQNAKGGFSRSSKGTLNLQTSEITKLRFILERWKLHIDSMLYFVQDGNENNLITKTYLRYRWAFIHKEETENADFQSSKFITDQLSELSDLLTFLSKDEEIDIKMPNYKNISDINVKSINDLCNTITVLTMFAKILYAKDTGNNDEAVYLLERTLIDADYFETTTTLQVVVDEAAISSIKSFLENSNIDMRLSLWNILFSYYYKEGDFSNFQFGFEKNSQTLLNFLKSSGYKNLSVSTRYSTLLKILSFYDEHLIMYLDHLSRRNWELDEKHHDSMKTTYAGLIELFQMMYLFSLHEEACLITSKKSSVAEGSPVIFNKFKAMIARSATIMIVYFNQLLKSSPLPENVNSEIERSGKTDLLLALFHSQFGYRRLCDAGDCILLQMFQDRLLVSNLEAHQNDILQILSCRYRCKITSNGFTPVDHQTESKAKFDKESIYNISKLVLPLCIERNPLINPPRGDLKALLDNFYEVINDPEYESSDSLLTKNVSILNQFLDDTIITPRFLKDCFYGLFSIDFLSVNDERSSVIKGGLFYLQAVIIFSSYKIRKKSMQGRSMEIENVINLLKSDLIYDSSRVESWFLLGQAYSFLVEDDLIWTSDKLVIQDRKVGTANLQRKSLLCYLTAISLATKDPVTTSKDKKLMSELMSSFASELFNACMSPMEMLAFKVTEHPRLLKVNNKFDFVTDIQRSSVGKDLCIKIIQQALHLAINLQPNEWFNFYLLSKIQGKRGLEAKLIFETLLEAIRHSMSPSISSPDLILEPHYRLCSIGYKYVKNNKLDSESVIEFILKDPIFENLQKPQLLENDNKPFNRFIVECLKKIESIDKKRWHHKYRYRLAKIHVDEFGELSQAREEMANIVSLKAISKTLVSIWKPDNERPGKHFYYTYQYVLLFIDILMQEKNLTSLIQMVPRLRRSNSIMVSLNQAWATLCNSICNLIRDLSEIDKIYTEQFLNTPYVNFIYKSKWMIEECKKNSLPKELKAHICLLNSLNEMKKLNNGFGQTALIDDTICALYIKIFRTLPEKIPDASTIASDPIYGKLKKLAKKDIYPFVNDLLKVSKRDIDNEMKERPDIFNEFAQQVQEERKSENKSSALVIIDQPTDGIPNQENQEQKPIEKISKSIAIKSTIDLNSPSLTATAPPSDCEIIEINSGTSVTPVPESPNPKVITTSPIIGDKILDESRANTQELEDFQDALENNDP